jgi:5-formyltetrahydrofolate cyclo-ligase
VDYWRELEHLDQKLSSIAARGGCFGAAGGPGGTPRGGACCLALLAAARLANRWGILEPRPELTQAEAPRPGDVIAVPAVALSRDGHRLGYGGGFYDRFLATTAALAVGIVYDPFLLESLPVEEHDARVAVIVTDQRTMNLA